MRDTLIFSPCQVTLVQAQSPVEGLGSLVDGKDVRARSGPCRRACCRSTRRSENPERPVTATMPDVIGGNAGRAYEQMSSELDMTFEDASGQDRPVDDPAEWKICNSRPGPNQQITDFPVVFGVVRASESCKDKTPK
ncbi:hypothetical protein [Streptomyces sp. NPDC046631]|uniref:hypothetical protein n=1 Tax=unclassified Streptomyces TaxID=2593676 RepID=UPI003405C2AB